MPDPPSPVVAPSFPATVSFPPVAPVVTGTKVTIDVALLLR